MTSMIDYLQELRPLSPSLESLTLFFFSKVVASLSEDVTSCLAIISQNKVDCCKFHQGHSAKGSLRTFSVLNDLISDYPFFRVFCAISRSSILCMLVSMVIRIWIWCYGLQSGVASAIAGHVALPEPIKPNQSIGKALKMLFDALSTDETRKKAWNTKTNNRAPTSHLLDNPDDKLRTSSHIHAQNLALKHFISTYPDTSLQLGQLSLFTAYSLLFFALFYTILFL